MQPSPIQLKDLTFFGIKITPRQLGEEVELGAAFDFDQVQIGERIELGELDNREDNEEKALFAVRLRIAIMNEQGKKAPYDIEIEAAGLFEVSDKIKAEDREDVAVVNGCAILYGAIREQVASYTSRSLNGIMMLPTVNFIDRKGSLHPKQAESTPDPS